MNARIETAPTPSTDCSEIPQIVQRLRASFDAGVPRPLSWRRRQLGQIRAMVNERADELTAALQADLRKPTLEAWVSDLGIARAEASLALKNLSKWTRPERVRTPVVQQPANARLVRDPLGVVLIIAPWNYPVQLLLCPLVGAVAAGNCVVLKPSEVTPYTSAALAKWIPKYLDPQCIALVEGSVPETTALLEQRFDHIMYTGNGQVARIVMTAAAKNLTPVTLELGGKSPCIVDADVDLPTTARRIAWGKFVNAGQTCIAPDYVLVHESMEEPLVEELGKVIREFYGEDPHRSPDFARIVNERHQSRLAGLLKDGDVAIGGQADASDRYIAPTILRNVSADSPVMRDEIFGPVLPILKVPSIDAAIKFVNQREKPLALYIFTNNLKVEHSVVNRTTSGGVCVNGILWQVANPNLPFGGVGPSGMGAYHGRHSFETFSHRKAVVTKSTRIDPKMAYPPYSAFMTRIVKRIM